MATELSAKLVWTFMAPTNVPEDVDNLLAPGEKAVAAFKTVRDVAIFTDKRLIVKDVQGITGKKVEIYSLPYARINMWSTENAGIVDLNSEVELWTMTGHIKIKLGRGIDIRQFDRLLSSAILI